MSESRADVQSSCKHSDDGGGTRELDLVVSDHNMGVGRHGRKDILQVEREIDSVESVGEVHLRSGATNDEKTRR